MQFIALHIFILFSCGVVEHVVPSLLEPIIENVVHVQTALPPPDTPGIWRKKMIWKARWVQEWKSAKTYRPVWRKVWSPVEIREWVPIPRPPPADIHKEDEYPSNHINSYPPVDLPQGPPPGFSQSPPQGPPQGVYGGPSQGPSQGPPSGVYGGPSPGPSQGPPSGVYGGPPQGPAGPPPSGPPQGPPSGPGQRPPQFRPMPSRPQPRPSNNYGPPRPASTALHPVVSDNPSPDWGAPSMQDLLSSYHTIKDTSSNNYQDSDPPKNYHANPDNEKLSDFFEPPKLEDNYRPRDDVSSGLSDKPSSGPVSPYAAKLAEAVIREKIRKSQDRAAGVRPSGITDIVYRGSDVASTTSGTVANSITATENPSNVYVVTPVSFG